LTKGTHTLAADLGDGANRTTTIVLK
jgi:hypothetical protein